MFVACAIMKLVLVKIIKQTNADVYIFNSFCNFYV